MKHQKVDAIFAQALDAQEDGEPIAAILQRYPAQAEELLPVLEAAALLQSRQPQPSPGAERASRERLLQAAAARQNMAGAPTGRSWFTRLTQVLAPLAAILLLSAALFAASQRALPGDAMYTLKLGLESAGVPGSAAVEQRRLSEVRALIDRGRRETVDFVAVLERVEGSQWLVGGIPVQLTPQTAVPTPPGVGSEIRVMGRTDGVGVMATRIEVVAAVLPTLPDIVQEDPTATATAMPTVTATATATPTATLQPTPTLAPTATPTATLVPTVVPTVTPDDDDDGGDSNDNSGDDNDDNDNGDDNERQRR